MKDFGRMKNESKALDSLYLAPRTSGPAPRTPLLAPCAFFLAGIAILSLAGAGMAKAAAFPPTLRGVHRVVIIGASITQFGAKPGGFVWLTQEYLRDLFPDNPIEIIDAGVGGNTSAQERARFQKDVLDRSPDLVLINPGFNDLWRGFNREHPGGNGPGRIPVATYKANVDAMITAALKAGRRVVLLTPTFFEDRIDSAGNTQVKDYVNAIQQLAEEHHLIAADENRALVTAWQTPHKGRLTVDGVHMTPAGDAIMAHALLLALGLKPADLDAAAPRVQQSLAAAKKR